MTSTKGQPMRPSQLPAWDAEDLSVARAFGDRWLEEARTSVLRVPSVVTEGWEYNILINPLHPQAPLIQPSDPEPMRWDMRLFGR